MRAQAPIAALRRSSGLGPDLNPPRLNGFIHQNGECSRPHLDLEISLPGLADESCLSGNIAHC
jgi:hypothetical protein